jgi:prepilin-type N-terminal cleavage/methylation domain-containing protein
MIRNKQQRSGFSLVELIVVIGIIAILIGLLLPSLKKVQGQALSVNCKANLKTIGVHMMVYSNENKGWLFPPGLGNALPPDQRWPVHVFKPPRYDPPILFCPTESDPTAPPRFNHTYILNGHLVDHRIRFGSSNIGQAMNTDVIVMGEKYFDVADYYMEHGDFATRVDPFKHGLRTGSNYLFLDMHVESKLFDRAGTLAKLSIDPWDLPVPTPTP